MHLNILPVLCLFSVAFAGSPHHLHHGRHFAGHLANRAVSALDPKATAQAHPRDTTAVRALTGTQIKTGDGRCLFVDPLSGDFRANLTPIQVGKCDNSQAQKWDLITKGAHNNVANATLLSSSLTNACGNVDTRRQPGDQVNLFSCGGRADGSGQVTESQLFRFKAHPGPHRLRPLNNLGSCLTVQGNRVGIEACVHGNRNQSFVFPGAADANGGNKGTATSTTTAAKTTAAKTTTAKTTAVTPPPAAATSAAPVNGGGKGNDNGTGQKPTPVSRGGNLNPTAVAEAQAFDKTATRFFESVSIQSSDGRCLSVDRTAGDFRENLIPVALVACQASNINQKFDIITKGKHNDGTHGKSALVMSVVTNGCISFDGRREASDRVNIFSCGGRADGSGQTNTGQLIPFDGEKNITFSPLSENKAVCYKGVGGNRLVSATCNEQPSRLFKLLFI
ncbi:hypothetical protein Micbo1qcDRAFT_16036 [Microdochium bolleyi]|uniref:Ricin B lectin domain-containing protein n=1 Tax=Microdochium bolleyi TaxID=196109 RepID=A0A136IVB1_9PEZI|nr:hypothetical protein Micbo1qcDRAFT_16036 [Microdochium bolleyi]